MAISQRDLNIIFIPARCSESSTEVFLWVAGCDEKTLFLDINTRSGGRIGWAELERCGEEQRRDGVMTSGYELARLHAADYQPQGPVVSLSGVLWPRREVLEQLAAGDASLPLAGLTFPASLPTRP